MNTELKLLMWIKELEDACLELLNAPHYEHFAVRLNDEEMAALDKIKQLLNQTT